MSIDKMLYDKEIPHLIDLWFTLYHDIYNKYKKYLSQETN